MRRYRAIGLFVLLGLLWGSSFPVVEIGLAYFPPVLFAALRFDVAALAMLAYAVSSADRVLPRGREEWATAAVTGAFVVAGFHALTYVGQLYVSGAVAAVVVSLGPVLATAFAAVLLPEERFAYTRGLGLALGIVGVTVIASPGTDQLLTASVVGIGLVFLASAAFNFGAVLTRRFRTDLPVPSMQAWGMVLGAPLLHLVAFARGETLAAVQWTVPATLSLGYLALVGGAAAYLLYFALLDRLGPAEITLVGYAEPPFAALVEWLLLGHVVDATTVLGFLAIVAGFAVIKRDALREVTLSRVRTVRS
ncbi:MAG: DMT family transporter [Haloarculaceae archaeon]